MSNLKINSIEILDNIIFGRVDPYIYAFSTNTVPNYLKVGDTYRPVSQRLKEWSKHFPKLKKEYENKAIINDHIYFRDFSVHKYLENDLKKVRLRPSDLDANVYYSKEFFKNTYKSDIEEAIKDIKNNFKDNTGKYEFYSSEERLKQNYKYSRGENWDLRPNQKEVVENFMKAINNGRKNLLMYAVMRFGKSFTSIYCALKMKAKLVLVVSAKADVKEEWKKTVESAGNFNDYEFLESRDLEKNENAIDEVLSRDKRVVLFLTLQDLQGKEIKEKHKEVFSQLIDLLIVDETHFGARAESYGAILKNAGYDLKDKKNINKLNDDHIDIVRADEEIKKINAKIRLHLSGTPYRILMGSEFEKEDIISFVQFSDIVKEQEKWDEDNIGKDDVNEWENPYYGFPQMVRFAFNPNESSRKKMEELKKQGYSYTLSKLFEPQSIKLDNRGNKHKKFKNESEILDLLQVIDGSKEDSNLLGFLDYDKIKDGKMCRHIVMVLPYCASCDAMENILLMNRDKFKNLDQYEIVNISGLESSNNYKDTLSIKNKIKEFEDKNQKTITLTVNRMLTGSTVEQWDTMLYFKDTSSPQEYDQSIFRLQNQYIRTLSSDSGKIKENMKPQTLLVDFDPNRLFKMQEQKSLIYNVNTDKNGNSKLKERMEEEISISPIITMNQNQIKEIKATDILKAIGEYNNNRSVADEVLDIPVDFSIVKDDDIKKTIDRQGEFNSKQGLIIKPFEGEGNEIDTGDGSENANNSDDNKKDVRESDDSNNNKNDNNKIIANKIKTYYQRILFYTFLTKDIVSSLDDIIKTIDSKDNKRISNNLYLEKNILEKLSILMDPFKRSNLDYKIQNISMLANDANIPYIERAMTSIKKFDRMSESEIVAPTELCKDMINLLPEDKLVAMVDKNKGFLDLGCKSGEYAVAIYNRLTQDIGLAHDRVKNLIYAIPTSSIAYEFTRKFFEILNLNVCNIAKEFNAYDLLNIKDSFGNIDYEKIKNLLEQGKEFREIKLDDNIEAGENKMKFGAVVGNPPYQLKGGSGGNNDSPIYQFFVNILLKTNISTGTFITPSRWFSAGRENLLGNFRRDMLNSGNVRTLYNFSNADDIFPNVELKGGVCYFLIDKDYIGPCNYYNVDEKNIFKQKRFLNDFDILIRDNLLNSVLKKITTKNKNMKYVSSIVSSDTPFGIPSNPRNSKKTPFNVYKTFGENHDIKLYHIENNKRKIEYVSMNDLSKNIIDIPKYKVFIPGSSGSGNDGFVIGKPELAGKNSVCSQSYLYSPFDEEIEALNFYKYLHTKFLRGIVSAIKITQSAPKRIYRFVPLQDFSMNSDINWNTSINKIDEQLFKKYDLSKEEIEHINNTIKDM